jgi:hypothetical protein
MKTRPHIIVASLLALFALVSCGGSGGGTTGTPQAVATYIPVNPNSIGINIDAPMDWASGRLYADVMTTAREFKLGADANSTVLAAVDANGWPMSDCSMFVWAGIDQMNGLYTLSFQGQAQVSGITIGNVATTYNPVTNTSTGTFYFPDPLISQLALSFLATKRTSVSALGSGVTGIKIMRPVSPGALQSYPPSTRFNDPLKVLIAKFGTIRFMDFLATNWNTQINWADRPLLGTASYNRAPIGSGWQGSGGPLEDVILLSNETGKDAWINIPVNATDAYVKNVALMFAYGSDGVNPYLAAQTNPVYPPLNANLKLHVEYSNEVWNAAFVQSRENCIAASNELVATSGVSPLNWDNTWNNVPYVASGVNSTWNWSMCSRRVAKRGVEISNIFRSVFGDAAMISRIRPELMTQLGAIAGITEAYKLLMNYYNNLDGSLPASAVAHPPNYYFYGAGGSGYYSPSSAVSSVDALFADTNMTTAGFSRILQTEASLVAAMGLKRVAYEGGASLDRLGTARDAISVQAANDSRMTTTMVNMHNAWTSAGGELLVYFTATGDYQWGFTPQVTNLITPKFSALDILNTSERVPLTVGTPVPGTALGSMPNVCSRGWGCAPIAPWDSFIASTNPTISMNQILWASYTFHSTTASQWTVKVSTISSTATPASLAVYVDGVLVGTQPVTGNTLSFNAGIINPGVHGVIVKAATGSFTVNTVEVL